MAATPTVFDTDAFKRATLKQWEQAAPGWNRHAPQIRAWLRSATDAMLGMADIRPGSRVLDVAAGAGDQTLDIAERVGPQGHVLATDLSPAILEFAKANTLRSGYRNVETLAVDAERLDLEQESYHAAVCRLGLMLFPAPLQALRQMHRALRPRGRICTMVFSTPESNPCLAILMSTALQHAGLPPRDPFQPGSLFSLGKPGVLEELFRTAGFREVATTRVKAPFKLPRTGDYLEFVRASASPIQQVLAGLDAERRQAAWNAMEERLKVFESAAGWEGPNEVLLTAALR